MFRDSFEQEEWLLLGEDIRLLIECRQEYSYPGVRMCLSFEPTRFPLADGRWALPVSGGGKDTDFEHDEYHRKLLTSSDQVEVSLGICSKIYWGYITHNEGYALNRVGWYLSGHQLPGTSPVRIATAMQEALVAPDEGIAISKFGGISQLGRVSFASKSLTGALPERSGVMDGKLDRGLRRSKWAAAAPFIGIGSVNSPRIQGAYKAWCEFLRHVAAQLNAGIELGAASYWAITDGVPVRWRAVDVERAIFAYYKREDRQISHSRDLSIGNRCLAPGSRIFVPV